MHFITTRIILLLIIAVSNDLLFRYVFKRRKKLYGIISLCVSLAVLCAAMLVPFENLFLHFKTPQEAFEYSFQDINIDQVVSDGTLAVALYKGNDGMTAYVTSYNKGNGWSVCNPYVTGKVSSNGWNGYIFITAKENSRMFISVISGSYLMSEPPVRTVSDSQNDPFSNFSIGAGQNKLTYYYTFTDWPMNGYSITLNGQTLQMGSKNSR